MRWLLLNERSNNVWSFWSTFSRIDPETKKLVEKLDGLKKAEPLKPELSVRVLKQRVKDPRTTYVLRRGGFLEPLLDSEVKPGGLSLLPNLVPRSANRLGDRLDLARWLVSPDNPLTPRVATNHVWRLLFGTGIVKTATDFGSEGSNLPIQNSWIGWRWNLWGNTTLFPIPIS